MYRSIIGKKEGKRHQKILDKMVTTYTCPQCGGTRLNEKIRSCKINGKNIGDVVEMPIPDAIEFIQSIDHPLAKELKKEIIKRLKALVDIGLGYLSLNRGMTTLSGGEAQRIKIAKYINSALTDLVYVLDEPSVGLHNHDIELLKNSLIKLRDHGNTILIIEHHKEIIKIADYIIDMGPKAGAQGGQIMFTGSYEELIKSDNLTGRLLNKKEALKSNLRKAKDWYPIENANLHNLKNISVKLPLGVLTVIAGVAGSGKSSLMEVFERTYPEEVVSIQQKDIGINSRSTPATYLDILDDIRNIFAKANKVSPGLFSFNSKGACPACKGKGVILSDMGFMDPIETICDLCNGSRYSEEALQYTYNNKNIAEVLDLTVEEAIDFFKGEDFVEKLYSLERVGLGYIRLNQSMTTLSGGELQRVKLASHLNLKGSIFIIDEPTGGLHIQDVKKLLDLFNYLVDEGNSLFVIEHNIDVIKEADYIIELGPGGGIHGGKILFHGTPREMLESKYSITRPYLLENLPDY